MSQNHEPPVYVAAMDKVSGPLSQKSNDGTQSVSERRCFLKLFYLVAVSLSRVFTTRPLARALERIFETDARVKIG
jgi:hypothetical protein